MHLVSNINGLLLLLAATLFTPSCGGKTDTSATTAGTLSVNPASVNISFERTTETLKVTSDCDWGVSVSDKEWMSVMPSGGIKGTTEVKVSIATNRTGKERTGTVTFRYGSKTLEVPVNQGYNEEDLPPDPGEIVEPEGYHLVWHDEFENGEQLNSKDWEWENQNAGWVNNELENYRPGTLAIDGKHTTELVDGSLLINCFRGSDGKIYSGRVNAKNGGKGWQYGYFEARIQLPKGKGTWPAFWMMPIYVDWTKPDAWPWCGEIDIMEEVGYHPNYVSSSFHAMGHYWKVPEKQVTKEILCPGAEDDYHIYALEWTESRMTTYVDGKVLLDYKNPGTGDIDWPYHVPFHLILNVAWGGDWGGNQGVDNNALPVTMLVDYVRVFQKN